MPTVSFCSVNAAVNRVLNMPLYSKQEGSLFCLQQISLLLQAG